MGEAIKRYCPVIRADRDRVGTARVNVYCVPMLPLCRSTFEKVIGQSIDWSLFE